jgi:hypothetical protein
MGGVERTPDADRNAPEPRQSALEWLLSQPASPSPRSKAAIDAELAAERDW